MPESIHYAHITSVSQLSSIGRTWLKHWHPVMVSLTNSRASHYRVRLMTGDLVNKPVLLDPCLTVVWKVGRGGTTGTEYITPRDTYIVGDRIHCKLTQYCMFSRNQWSYGLEYDFGKYFLRPNLIGREKMDEIAQVFCIFCTWMDNTKLYVLPLTSAKKSGQIRPHSKQLRLG